MYEGESEEGKEEVEYIEPSAALSSLYQVTEPGREDGEPRPSPTQSLRISDAQRRFAPTPIKGSPYILLTK